MSCEDRDRGQLILLAAAVAAAALVPMALAYLTLSAHPDVAATAEHDRPAEDALRALDRAATNASTAVGRHPWGERERAVDEFDAAIASDVREIESAWLTETVAVDVARNATVAERWATTNCPRGPNRAFGACEAIDGVVVQERAGETTPLAVGVDIRVTEPDGTAALTVVLPIK
ncbi:DUF7261 family protein [Halobaculum gomorrense]|uniref:Uncharacterized protein n=1 Tax=Halobaculum gomorrense TaxID=43928 RepID=A0A1M5JJ96_9EURY|nr:hypothetical protein [Halobaculum gomorrense]SHG40622.1 hypothetical protein SAMN05443636_0134 [Halobaculum gomorrense]